MASSDEHHLFELFVENVRELDPLDQDQPEIMDAHRNIRMLG